MMIVEKFDNLGWNAEGISCKSFSRKIKLIQGLDLRTDEAFLRSAGGEVRRIMERRRGCGECGITCEVVRGRLCFGAIKQRARVKVDKKWFDRQWILGVSILGLGVFLWWMTGRSHEEPLIAPVLLTSW